MLLSVKCHIANCPVTIHLWQHKHINFYGRKRMVNLSPLSAAYLRQWIESTLLQITACRLFGRQAISQPMLGYCIQRDLNKKTFSFIKMHLKMSGKWRPICPREDELMHVSAPIPMGRRDWKRGRPILPAYIRNDIRHLHCVWWQPGATFCEWLSA